MGQLVAGAAGAAIGFFVGGPTGAQIGWALGSALYASQQVIKGPSLGDAKVQTSQDGLPIAIIYGTSDCYGNVIDALPVEYEYVDVDSGGKGGPQQQEQRAYQTFAIMFCEGEAAGVRRIWENEKLVYDASEDSQIVEESSEYAQGFTFYPGSETQLPDPELEAYHGVGLTPAYRGICYIVWKNKDITNFGVAIPQMRVEIVRAGTEVTDPGWMATIGTGGSPGETQTSFSYSDDGKIWPSDEYTEAPNVSIRYLARYENYVIASGIENGTRNISTDLGQTFTTYNSGGAAWDAAGGRCVFDQDGTLYCCGGNSLPLLKSEDFGVTFTTPSSSTLSYLNDIAVAGSTLVGLGITSAARRSGDGGVSWANVGTFTSSSSVTNRRIKYGQNLFVASWAEGGGVENDRDPKIAWSDDSGTSWNDGGSPFTTTCTPTALCFDPEIEGGRWCIVASNGQVGISSNGKAWSLAATSFGVRLNDVKSDGSKFVLCGSNGLIAWSADGSVWTTVSPTPAGTNAFYEVLPLAFAAEVTTERVNVADIIADQCERKGVTSGLRDVSLITDTTRGFKVAGNYNAADVIRTLGQVYFFDSPEYDGKIRFIPRGRAAVLSIPSDDFVAEPEVEEYSQGEHAIEYPRVLRLVYAPEETQYQATTQTSERYSPSLEVKGEVVIEAPVNLETDEAAQIADKAHKAAWADAQGEVRFSVGDNYAELVPSDCIGVEVNGKLSRLRITAIEDVDGERRITARFDRQSAYTSNVTGIPPLPATSPPPALVGETDFQWCNLPPLRGYDDGKLYYVGVQGLTDGWAGANIQRSNDGGSTWETVIPGATFPTLIGTAAELPAHSRYRIDEYNTLTITIPASTTQGTIDTFLSPQTEQYVQSGLNVISLQNADGTNPEIIQFRNATEITPGTWELTGLNRGMRDTLPRAHTAGERAVFVNPSYVVTDNGAQFYSEFKLRAVSISNVAAGATTIDVDWTPPRIVIEWAPVLPPPWRGGAEATVARDAIIDAGTLDRTFFAPCRTSADKVYVCAIVRGRKIFGNSFELSSGFVTHALVVYSDGLDNYAVTVPVTTEWPLSGSPPFAPTYAIRHTLTAAEQTAIWGSVPSSLDVSIILESQLTGYAGGELEFTV